MDVSELTREHRDMACGLWREAGLNRAWNSPEEDFDRALAGPSSTVLGVVRDGVVVATAMVGHDGHRGWVYYVAVSDELQGQGIGSRLMSSAEDWVRRAGVPKLQLMVRDENDAAQGFYRRLGYEDAHVTTLGRWL